MLATEFTDHVIAWGTIGLGVMTLCLAVATCFLVVQTRAAAATARAALQADVEPLLVDVPPSATPPPDIPLSAGGRPAPFVLVFEDELHAVQIDPRDAYLARAGGRIYASVPLRNVGRGLARVLTARLVVAGLDADTVIRRQIVPPGESTRVDFVSAVALTDAPAVQIAKNGPRFVIGYGDAGGTQEFEVRFGLQPSRDHWYVTDLEHRVVPQADAARWVLDDMAVGTLGLRFSFERHSLDRPRDRDVLRLGLPFGFRVGLSRASRSENSSRGGRSDA